MFEMFEHEGFRPNGAAPIATPDRGPQPRRCVGLNEFALRAPTLGRVPSDDCQPARPCPGSDQRAVSSFRKRFREGIRVALQGQHRRALRTVEASLGGPRDTCFGKTLHVCRICCIARSLRDEKGAFASLDPEIDGSILSPSESLAAPTHASAALPRGRNMTVSATDIEQALRRLSDLPVHVDSWLVETGLDRTDDDALWGLGNPSGRQD